MAPATTALCSPAGVGYHTAPAAGPPPPGLRPPRRRAPLWAAGLALALVMAVGLMLPAHSATQLEVQDSSARRGPQYGEVGKIVRAGGLRFLYSYVGSYLGSLVGSEVGATTGQVLDGGRGLRVGEYVGDLFGGAAGSELGRAAAEREIVQLGWNVSRPARKGKPQHAPVDVGGRLGRWVGGVAGADYGAVHGRRAATKGGERRSVSRQYFGQAVGTLLGRQAGASLGEWVGHTLQVGIEHADDVIHDREEVTEAASVKP